MGEQSEIYEIAQTLVPETCELLGPQKVLMIIDDVVAGREPSFTTPEHGHPMHFIDQIRDLIEIVAATVAMIGAVNRVRDSVIQSQKDDATAERSHATAIVRVKEAIGRVISNIK